MAVSIVLLLIGLALVVFGADWLVDGASGIARKAGISEFVIGLTIVGFGTSCPELVVSVTGALGGSSDISVGNVLGSNIFNTLLILGVTGLIYPIAITYSNRTRDIPITMGVTFLFIAVGMKQTLFGVGENGISRLWGIIFLLLFAFYLYICFKYDKPDNDTESDKKEIPIIRAIILSFIGLAALLYGGNMFVDHAVDVAHRLGVSEKFIAITILAGGTSLPELVTCIVAAAKKRGQLALGNILGSNIFNILLILGVSSSVTPLSFENMNMVDAIVLLVSIILVMLSSYTGRNNKLGRGDGTVMLAAFAGYYVWLFTQL